MVLDPTPGGAAGTLVVQGNLQVEGTTTTINSTTLTVDDKNIELAQGGGCKCCRLCRYLGSGCECTYLL